MKKIISEPNPSGLCLCGCGQPTSLAPVTDRTKGWVKGKPLKFIRYHNARTIEKGENHPHHVPIEKRFWNKVAKKDTDECWEWTGFRNQQGYGYVTVNGKTERAHRISYILSFGDIPEEINVLHKCDNPPCCNPDHLFLGTLNDNVQDMIKKGRKAVLKGEKHGMARLTASQVKSIRQRHNDGERDYLLAKEYRVTQAAIYNIVNRITWRHLE